MTARKPTTSPTKPKYALVGDTFIAQSDGGEIKIPLRVKTKVFREIRNVEADDVDQLFAVLEGMGNTKAAEQVGELDILDSYELAREFFERWAERQEARLGESSSSSTSSRSTGEPSGTTSETASD